MTKMQTLRSSVTKARPASGSQAPGVLYVNFADLQLGVMNTAGDPQDLLAIRFYSENTTYNPGDLVVEGGSIWIAGDNTAQGPFDPSQWGMIGETPVTMPVGGGTDKIFYENDQFVTTDYAIAAGKNAGSFGPVTVNAGVNVTIPPNSNWTVI